LAVSTSLTSIDVGFNKIDRASARLILEAMKGKDMQFIGMGDCSLGVEEARTLAEYIGVMPSLTSLRLGDNLLEDEGVTSICEAMQSNKETKLTVLDVSENQVGPKGGKSVAAMLAITTSLTLVDLSNNMLCGMYWDDVYEEWTGTYTAEGIKAIADALGVNTSLTSLDVSGVRYKPHNLKGSGTVFGEALKSNKSMKELKMKYCELDAEDGKGLAVGLAFSASLTSLNIKDNHLNEQSKILLKNAVTGKQEFNLEL